MLCYKKTFAEQLKTNPMKTQALSTWCQLSSTTVRCTS